MKKTNWIGILISIAIPFVFGFIGNILGGGTELYKEIIKPNLSPPSWVFGIAWSIIYLLIGLASYLVYTSSYAKKDKAINVYFIQLFINSLWTLLFFRFNLYYISFLWILLLFLITALNAYLFYKANKISGLLFIPYLLWLAYASYLSYMIYLLN